jgi:NAD(P)-dependent dehydrogenase (short-subunit alcohol dehydrogenase family)
VADISFEGRTVIVTGAARGLGRSYALELCRRGASVLINDVDGDLLAKVEAEITAEGGRAFPCVDSVATVEGAGNVVDTAIREFGSIDVLVNNAGVLRTGYFADLTVEEIDEVLNVHLRAPFILTRLVWPLMTKRQYGRIVMVSSTSGMFSHQGLSNYAGGKAGVYGLTKALAFEGADHGIKVNAILPNATTPGHALKEPIPDYKEFQARYLRKPAVIPDWRLEPFTNTALAVYLASSQCEYSGEAFGACYGRYGRVFVAVADGWIAPDRESITTENIAAHFDEIRDVSRHTIPMWQYEYTRDILERIDDLGYDASGEE